MIFRTICPVGKFSTEVADSGMLKHSTGNGRSHSDRMPVAVGFNPRSEWTQGVSASRSDA